MRALYKALARVGMIALSTAAALGVRHLSKASKKRREAQDNEEQPVQDIDFIDEDEARKEAEEADKAADDSDKSPKLTSNPIILWMHNRSYSC